MAEKLPKDFVVDGEEQSGDLPPDFVIDGETPEVTQVAAIAPQESFLERAARISPNLAFPIAAGETAISLMSALPAGIGSGITGGLALSAGGQDLPTAVDTMQNVQSALTFQPRTELGQRMIGGIGDFFEGTRTSLRDTITEPPEPLEPRANPFAVRDTKGGLGIDSPAAATALETGIDAGLMALGARRRNAPRSRLNSRQRTALEAREKGIGISAGEEGGALGVAEGLSGRARNRQTVAHKNIPVYKRLANEDLGRVTRLPDGRVVADAPITARDLQIYRNQRGQAYAVIDDVGNMTIDTQFRQQVRRTAGDVRSAAKDVPSLVNAEVKQLLNVVDDLASRRRVGRNIKASSLRGTLRRIRSETDKAFRDGNTDLALAYKELGKSLEDLVERNLARANNPQAMAEFRAARQDIAKSYSYQEALKGDDIINPASLARQRARGEPLSGNADLIARAHEQFPQSTNVTPVTIEGPQVASAVEGFIGLGGIGLAQPELLAIPAAGVATRAGLSRAAFRPSLLRPRDTGVPGLLGAGAFIERPLSLEEALE